MDLSEQNKINQINEINTSASREKTDLDKGVFYVATGLIIFSVTLAQWLKSSYNIRFLAYSWVLNVSSIVFHLLAYRFSIAHFSYQRKIIYERNIDKNTLEKFLGLKRDPYEIIANWCDYLAEIVLLFAIVYLLLYAFFNIKNGIS